MVILIGAFGALWLGGRNSNLPPTTGEAKQDVDFQIDSSDHVKGAENAKVTIVEYADFQCPACRAYFPVVDELLKQYPNDVRLVYRHFPLKTIHYAAVESSRVAEAAGLQGKFWEAYEMIYNRQDEWANNPKSEVFNEIAKDLNLDMEKFQSDRSSKEVADRVERDYNSAISINLNSTPTFYMNNVKISNPSSLDEFMKLVDAELSK